MKNLTLIRHIFLCFFSIIIITGCDDTNSNDKKDSSDNIAPAITLTSPKNSSSDIAINASVLIYFSERMNKASTENAITINPVISDVSYTWMNNDTMLRMNHTSDFNSTTTYMITVDTGATDVSGNNLESSYEFSFTTDEHTVTSGGNEDILEGAWWITGYASSDGAYFDGTGNGYDMSGTYPDALYVECGDLLTYTYDGSNFSKTEGGTTVSGTFTLNSDGMGGTLIVGAYSFTVVKVTTYTVDGDCLD